MPRGEVGLEVRLKKKKNYQFKRNFFRKCIF